MDHSRATDESIGVQRLEVLVDGAALRQSDRQVITGGIWFAGGDVGFPATGWNDFVVVILGWWLTELRALPALGNPRATIKLEFMDGPYEIELSAPHAMEGPWSARFVHRGTSRRLVRDVQVSGHAVIRSIRRASRLVLAECDDRGWVSRDVDALRSGPTALRE